MKIGKMQVVFGDRKDENGNDITCIKKITIDAPTVRLEDKTGSMLGAVALENNYFEMVRALSVFHDVDVSNMFNDDFEIAIRDKEIDLPRIELETTEVLNARITCGEGDGFLISKIDIADGKALLENVRVNLAKIKMRFDAITIDPESHTFTIDKLALRNPAEFPEENAFLMGKFILSTHAKEENIRGNRVLTLESLTLKDFFVRLDSRTGEISSLLGGDNNLFGLIDDFKDASLRVPAFKDSVQEQINEDTTVRPRRYIIKKINFEGGEIRIGPRGDAIKIPMADFAIENLGLKTGGVTADEIAVVLIREIALRAIESAEDRLAEGWGFLKPVVKALHGLVRMLM